MAYNPLNPNGQATMANSQPIVIANNQTAVSVTGTVNIGTIPGSVVAFAAGNQSVSGTVLVNNGSVAAWLQSSNASVITVGTAVPNQSVSGTVGASIIGLSPFVLGGSTNASVITVGGSGPANQSVSGTVGASVIGTVPVTQGGTWIASVFGNFSVVGTVPVTQSTSPWTVVSSIAGGIFPISGSVAATITNTNINVSGSVAAFQAGTQVTSLVSTVPSSVIVGTSIFGQLPAGTAPIGSVATLQGTNPWNVAGSVASFQAGTWSSSVMTNVITSIATAGQVMGSVAALQGTNPWIVNFANSSILAVPVGSVITVFQAPSIVGTYAEDAAHTTADKGIFTLGVRNDAVASFVGANLDYSPTATDSAGRILIKPFAPEESRVEGYASTVNVSVTTLVAAAGTGLRNYITDIVLANTGAATTLVTFKSGGGASILGYGIAPTAGGSNMLNFATPIRTGANETFDFQATTGTSILYATVKGFKAP